jgi:GxxExxY protein
MVFWIGSLSNWLLTISVRSPCLRVSVVGFREHVSPISSTCSTDGDRHQGGPLSATGDGVVVVGDETLSGCVIGAAIEVHRSLGPGLLESIYSRCLTVELQHLGLSFATEVAVPLTYRGVELPALRADLVVERSLLVEVKSVEHLSQLHLAQTLSYLRLLGLKKGLLINFNVTMLKAGIRSVVA